MSDRELLELAAKAHGDIPAAVVGAEPGYYWCGATCAPQWNPLADDGDALRLAVKLKLFVDNCGAFSECAGFVGDDDDTRRIGCEELHEHHGVDPYAATRRAIVRAAAEIGRGMGGSKAEVSRAGTASAALPGSGSLEDT